MALSLQLLPELVQRLHAPALELLHPAVVDLVDGHGVQEVELLAAPPRGADEVRLLELREVLRDGLAAHPHPLAELAQREPARLEQPVQQLAPAGIRECLEHRVHPFPPAVFIMQAFTCMSSAKISTRPAARPRRPGRGSPAQAAAPGVRAARASADRTAASGGRP